jgi:hypothetical protein
LINEMKAIGGGEPKAEIKYRKKPGKRLQERNPPRT